MDCEGDEHGTGNLLIDELYFISSQTDNKY